MILKKLPGFRSGIWWKQVIAGLIYGALLINAIVIMINVLLTAITSH